MYAFSVFERVFKDFGLPRAIRTDNGYWRGVAHAYILLHRYEDALSALTHSRVRKYQIAALTAGCHARLGAMERAKASVVECLSLRPDFSIAHFMRNEPFKIPADAEQLAASLRLAGLPD